ncbi:hypothetical protein HFO45_17045 [Rhizobium leguminosarum]|uniref:hypothetical protein n=1 Tax=Rhizobium leguminosarum TaxID=384 RepID=UPI001C95AE96|nr:hypothetical protein [Rhizobium leguminosarum]MBY5649953.1 hypothetical protein [Rhizobium leguminosarum]
MDYDIAVQSHACVEVVHDMVKRAYAEGLKAGQDAMHERAASLIAHPQCDFSEPQDAADAIRALPIEETTAS